MSNESELIWLKQNISYLYSHTLKYQQLSQDRIGLQHFLIDTAFKKNKQTNTKPNQTKKTPLPEMYDLL